MKYTWNEDPHSDLWVRGGFNTIEECIEEAKQLEINGNIMVGEIIPFEPHVNVYSVLEEIEQDASEECGEVGNDWEIDTRGNTTDSLAEKLTQCVKDWLKETGQEPTFYKIGRTREVEVD